MEDSDSATKNCAQKASTVCKGTYWSTGNSERHLQLQKMAQKGRL
jgi:hypothetical protein